MIAHTAQFTNPSGVQPAEPQTIFILHPAFQKIYVVGDVGAWNAANPGVGGVEVVRMLHFIYFSFLVVFCHQLLCGTP